MFRPFNLKLSWSVISTKHGLKKEKKKRERGGGGAEEEEEKKKVVPCVYFLSSSFKNFFVYTFSIFRTSLGHSVRENLLITNSLIFPSSENVLDPFTGMKNIFGAPDILVDSYFFNDVKIMWHKLLDFLSYEEK